MAGINYNAYYRLARLDKPAGAWLLLLPCWMGLALAGGGWRSYLLFAMGAVAMRAAGCVINDMADRRFDAKVERTKNRPLASGEIKLPGAFLFLAMLLFTGLLVLAQLPPPSVIIALCSVPLIVVYPFMKRVTYWPQLFLGLVFNIGVLVAYAAIAGEVSVAAMALYAGAACWTLGYDTIYAHQDKADDIAAGVKSTALRLGAESAWFIAGCYALFVMAITCAGQLAGGFGMLNITALAALCAHFTWQVRKLDIDNPQNCLMLFRSNIYAGLAAVSGTGVMAVRAGNGAGSIFKWR